MAVLPEQQPLPYGIGRLTPGWLLAIAAYMMLVGLGAFAYSRQIMEGEIVTGLRDVGTRGGAPWGLYIAFELWFVGIGFGSMLLLGLIRIGRIQHLQPLTRALGLTAMATLFVGGWSVIADVGQPARAIVNILRYARPGSPFFGTFTIGVVAAFSVTLVYLYLDSRRDAALLAKRPTRWRGFLRLMAAGYRDTDAERKRRRQVSAVMAIALLGVGVIAASTSGFVFGIQEGRPGWFSALQAPGFVVLAGVTGTASTIIVAAILRNALGERERLDLRLFAWLNNLLLILTIIYVYFVLVELVTASYSAHHHEARVTEAILTGQYAWLFWLTSGVFLLSVAIGAAQAVSRRHYLPAIVAVAALVNLAAFGKRYLLVVPPLTKGNLLPYSDGSYTPSWIEWAVVLGLVALGAVWFMVVTKVFPVMDVRDES